MLNSLCPSKLGGRAQCAEGVCPNSFPFSVLIRLCRLESALAYSQFSVFPPPSPSLPGRKGPLEKVLNILSCPLRGAIPIATRGLAGVGLLYII